MRTYEGYRRHKGAWQPSAAQRRVLDELLAGRTNAEIAVRLGLSAETVKSHIGRMLGETGCADRQALARWWRSRPQRPPLLVPLVGLAARVLAGLAALALGGLVLVAGIAAVARVASSLKPAPRLVSVGRPADPLPTPIPSAPTAPPSSPRAPLDLLWVQDGGAVRLGTINSVALDPAGNVYIAEAGRHTIQKYAPDGSPLVAWGGLGSGDGQFAFRSDSGAPGVSGLDIDAQGRVYVADGTGRVQIFDGDGRFLRVWPTTKGRGLGQIDTPRGLAIDRAGYVYIVDAGAAAVLKFDADGRPIARWGHEGTGNGEFQAPAGIAVDAQGAIYVADSGNQRIQKLDAAGGFLFAWGKGGGGDGEFSGPLGLTADDRGDVYVADSGGHRIQKFDAAGRYLQQGGLPGITIQELNYFSDIAVDPQGDLYVTDSAGRLRKVRLR